MTTASITFTYNVEKDDDLHKWLTALEKDRSRAIREMLKCGLKQSSDVTLELILEEIRAIRENSHGPPVIEHMSATAPANVAPDIAPDILQNLRNLGK